MSSNLLDAAFAWIGTGAGFPQICVPLAAPPLRRHRFGDPDGTSVHDSLLLEPAVGLQVRAPANGMLWQLPAPSSLRADDGVLPSWPHLTRIGGQRFDPRTAPADFAEFDLLLEVWPSAFRRLEYVFSSLEVPAGVAGWDQPQMPAPRWFWIRGTGALGPRAQNIADGQFAGSGITPDLTAFVAGKAPLYVSAGDVLAVIDDDNGQAIPIEIRAFDSMGGVIDPDWVFAMFDRVGTDSDFGSLRLPWPGGQQPWNPPARHVLTFCDGSGAPYVSRVDPDAATVEPPPPRTLSLVGVADVPIPSHGVVVIEESDPAYAALNEPFVRLELPGEHQRLTLLPHGTLAKRALASFGTHSFFRVQVVDFARWFPTSANIRNVAAGDDAFARYTDGNEIVPLIDGRHMLREVYRALRATHVVESYASEDDVPALDPAHVPDLPDSGRMAKARILLTNAWIDADTAMLGRRALIAAPRTQTDPLPDIGTVVDGFVVVGALPPLGVADPAAPSGSLPDYRLWWLVSTTPLPPGTYVDVRQMAFADALSGDDPRLPGVLPSDDLYGVLAPLGGSAATGSAFVGASGHCVLPVLLKNGEPPRAHVRIVTWAPDEEATVSTDAASLAGVKRVVASGEVTLPVPDVVDRQSAPAFSRPGVQAPPAMRLEFDGVPGRATVVISGDSLTTGAPVSVVVMNASTGEVSVTPHVGTGADLRVAVTPFALKDWVLVGFGVNLSGDPRDVGAFFMLRATPEQMMAGAAVGHPTQVLGALQETMRAGVDTRLLAWKGTDVLPEERVYSAAGMVAALNAGVAGSRGQAIYDALTRHEFCVHHQKAAFIRTARPANEDGGGATAFLGGIDLMNRRWDRAAHDALEPERQGGPWHDVHCRVRGRAVWDVYRNFRQRWNAALEQPDLVGSDPGWTPLPPVSDVTAHGAFVEDDETVTLQTGDCTAQINRTLAPHIPEYAGFLDTNAGDLSIRKAYRRVIDEARQFLYIEDQYFWDRDLSQRIHDALIDGRLEFVMLLMPRSLSEFPTGDLVLYAQRRRSLLTLLYGVSEVPDGVDPRTLPGNVSDRVVVFTIANDAAQPVYVHCKTIVADDLWVSISSSNLTRRSMTYDGEIGVMAIDRRTRRGGQRLARDLRVELMAAHLGLTEAERALVDDPRQAFRLVKDYLAGAWPGRHLPIESSGIAEMDLLYTHYGVQPADVDGTFVDLINAGADPDGTQDISLPGGLLEVRELQAALKAGTDTMPFGGIGTLRLSFDVSALGVPPADLLVTVSLIPDGSPESARVSFPARSAADLLSAGLVRIGGTYRVSAAAARAAAPGMVIGIPLVDQPLPAVTGFDTTLTVVLPAS